MTAARANYGVYYVELLFTYTCECGLNSSSSRVLEITQCTGRRLETARRGVRGHCVLSHLYFHVAVQRRKEILFADREQIARRHRHRSDRLWLFTVEKGRGQFHF